MNLFRPKITQSWLLKAEQVETAIQLLDGGATVPFLLVIVKKSLKGLDDTQLHF